MKFKCCKINGLWRLEVSSRLTNNMHWARVYMFDSWSNAKQGAIFEYRLYLSGIRHVHPTGGAYN